MGYRALSYAPGQQLRTGLTHFFRRAEGVDRSAARAVWERAASGELTSHTSGLAPGFVQANMVAVEREHAFDFLTFCLRNPQPCPLLDVSEPGMPEARLTAAGADLRNAVPKYRVWRKGVLEREVESVEDVWAEADSFVCFLLGCSFSWENQLTDAGLQPRHIEQGCNVPMYRTAIPNTPAGPFAGHLVVSMRPYPMAAVPRIQEITGKYPGAHGAPVHWGSPEAIGIEQLGAPDFGDAVELRDDEVPVFWACGVTPQTALEDAKLSVAVTHSPGCMMILDLLNSELLVE